LNSTWTFTSDAATWSAPASRPAKSVAASSGVLMNPYRPSPFPADAEAIERDALLAMRLHLLLERVGIDVAEIRRAVGEEHDAVHARRQVMPEGGLVGEVHRVFEVRAALGREAADLVEHGAGLVAGHAIHPKTRGAREGDDADPVLRLQLRGEHAQRLADDLDAIGPLH
jgi:hypothetical protein